MSPRIQVQPLVLECIDALGGTASGQEIAEYVGRTHQRISPTLVEMQKNGKIVRTGKHGESEYHRNPDYAGPAPKAKPAKPVVRVSTQTNDDRIIRALTSLGGTGTISAVAQACGVTRQTMEHAMRSAYKRGVVVQHKRFAPYELPKATNGNGNGNGHKVADKEPTAEDARVRQTQDDKIAAMLAIAIGGNEDDWLRILQLIEVARGVVR